MSGPVVEVEPAQAGVLATTISEDGRTRWSLSVTRYGFGVYRHVREPGRARWKFSTMMATGTPADLEALCALLAAAEGGGDE